MTVDSFCSMYPQLFHMATGDSLHSIKKYGLMSTRSILDLVQLPDTLASQLMTTRRPDSITVSHPEHGSFTLRDQKPLDDHKLAGCLVDMSVPEWYEHLNTRSFLWATRSRLETLANARPYRGIRRLILTINSVPFAKAYAKQIEVSTINSGATFYVPVARGRQTFVRLTDFVQPKGKTIAEITVIGGIPDIAKFIENVEVREPTQN